VVWSAGYGPQKLATLAAYALRRNLLDWLETFKVEKVCAERMRSQAEQLKASFLHSKLIPTGSYLLTSISCAQHAT
jgi:hypothetical protein